MSQIRLLLVPLSLGLVGSSCATQLPYDDCEGQCEETPLACSEDAELPELPGDEETALVDLGEYQPPCSYPWGPSAPGFRISGPEIIIEDPDAVQELLDNGGSVSYGNFYYGYRLGTAEAKRCLVAGLVRFEQIMSDPPESLLALKEMGWSGAFYNWTNDYTGTENGSARFRSLWFYNNYLIKFISETNNDGTCFLPTRSMIDEFAQTCSVDDDGEVSCGRSSQYPDYVPEPEEPEEVDGENEAADDGQESPDEGAEGTPEDTSTPPDTTPDTTPDSGESEEQPEGETGSGTGS